VVPFRAKRPEIHTAGLLQLRSVGHWITGSVGLCTHWGEVDQVSATRGVYDPPYGQLACLVPTAQWLAHIWLMARSLPPLLPPRDR
jgi:hypothetical protein